MIDFEAAFTQEFPNIAPSNKGKMKERAVVSVLYTAVYHLGSIGRYSRCISRLSENTVKNDYKPTK